jgi:hypothetical protein
VCGILFTLEPPAVNIIWTQHPSVTPLGRTGGISNLRLEEDIVVEIIDQAGIRHIRYE